jgi:hypothetical protein
MDVRPGTAPSDFARQHAGTAVVRWPTNWDRDDRVLSYEVLRGHAVISSVLGGSTFWKRPVISRTDSGLSANTNYSYRIRVTDPAGNTVTSAATIFRYPPVAEYAQPNRVRRGNPPVAIQQPAGTPAEPDLAGSTNLSLADDVTLGVAGASAANTGTAASVAGTNPSGSSTTVPEASTAQGSIEFWFKTAKPAAPWSRSALATASTPPRRTFERGAVPQRRWSAVLRGRKPASDTVKPSIAETPGSLADSKWHHVVAVQTGTRCCSNSTVSSRPRRSPIRWSPSNGRWWVGGRTPAKLPERLTSGFAGQIDELSVFPRP